MNTDEFNLVDRDIHTQREQLAIEYESMLAHFHQPPPK